MRKNNPPGGLVGLIAICLGVLVILALVLPSGFWWMLLGVGLITGGIFAIRKC